MGIFSRLTAENMRTLRPYIPGKPTEELERELNIKNIIKMASNENPIGPSPIVLNRLKESIEEVSVYPDGSCHQLKSILSKHLSLPSKNIVIGNGSNELIVLLAELFLSAGLEAIHAEGAFVVYGTAIQLTGAKPVVVPMRNNTHDLDAMLNAVTDRTRIIFVANPSNPQGSIVSHEQLKTFIEKLPDHVIPIIDEAYFEYVTDKSYPDSISLMRINPNIVILRTFSKIYGLAGLRLGYGIAHMEIGDLINRVRQPFNVNSLAQSAGCLAVLDQDHVKKGIELNSTGMHWLSGELKNLNLNFIPSQGNFLLIDCKRNGQLVYDSLLSKGVIVRPMKGYGYPHHIRVTIGTSEMNDRFIDSLSSVLSEIPASN